MLNIEVNFSLPLGYRNAFVTLFEREHRMAFTLVEGTHTAESEVVDLGVVDGFGGRRLLGKFGFEYTYERERRVITVSGTDFDSAGSMCLTTFPEGTTEVCRQRCAGGGFVADDLGANPHWNYVTSLTPGLFDVLKGAVRTVNDRMIQALEAAPELIVQVRKQAPALPADIYEKFVAVYHDGEIFSLHEPGKQYGPGDEVVSIESVFGGEVTLNYGDNFANVIGSTHDPKIHGESWLHVWAVQFGVPNICTSWHFPSNFPCGPVLVGGHSIDGTQAHYVAKGSNSVWILPICVQHNNNDHVHMRALKYVKGIWLKNYMGH